MLAGIFFFLYTAKRAADLRHAIMQAQARSGERRSPIIGQGGTHGQTVVADRLVFRRGMLFECPFSGSHPAQLLLQEGFRMTIGFVENGLIASLRE